MTRWTLLLITIILVAAVVLVFTASAQAKSEPVRLYHPKTATKYKLVIIKRVVRHAGHVRVFFEGHPKQARSKAGRAALWRQVRILRVALREVRKIRRELWLELPYTNDWRTAVLIAQRPFPGTRSFLWETSGDEGGHGGCVEHGGAPCALPVYGVAGNMQYMSGTFSGHYRRALDDLRARGFTVPERLRDAQSVEAWFSPMAQALAAGWACYRHQTYSHWSASGNRC